MGSEDLPSHQICSAGGEHLFDDINEEEIINGDIVQSETCSKCKEVTVNQILVTDGSYEYEDCDASVCKGSEKGHEWNTEFIENMSPDKYYMDECFNCNGSRIEWYRHKHTIYNGPGNKELYRWSD